MIVPPGPSHATRANVVRYDVAVVGKPFLAEGADAILRGNLSVHQLPHLGIGTDLPIPARVLGIVDPADSHLACSPVIGNRFSAAAELRAVNRAKLISAESHGFLQFGFEEFDWLENEAEFLKTEARASVATPELETSAGEAAIKPRRTGPSEYRPARPTADRITRYPSQALL
jgi:hypothetical protein